MRRGAGLFVGLTLMLSVTAPFAPEVPSARAGEALIPVGAFEIVPGGSSVAFMVPDNRGGFSGQTTRVTGRIVVMPDAGGEDYTARVEAGIDAASITTGNGLRDAAMRSAYLRTAQFPSITFAGTAAARPGLAVLPFAATVRGRLTIRDQTRDVEFTAKITALARDYLADGQATIRMADYQIPYPRAFIFVARDPVTVSFHLRARQSGTAQGQ